MNDMLEEIAQEIGVEFLGIITLDDEIAQFNLEGRSLFDLADDSPPVEAIRSMAKKMKLIA